MSDTWPLVCLDRARDAADIQMADRNSMLTRSHVLFAVGAVGWYLSDHTVWTAVAVLALTALWMTIGYPWSWHWASDTKILLGEEWENAGSDATKIGTLAEFVGEGVDSGSRVLTFLWWVYLSMQVLTAALVLATVVGMTVGAR